MRRGPSRQEEDRGKVQNRFFKFVLNFFEFLFEPHHFATKVSGVLGGANLQGPAPGSHFISKGILIKAPHLYLTFSWGSGAVYSSMAGLGPTQLLEIDLERAMARQNKRREKRKARARRHWAYEMQAHLVLNWDT